MHWNYDLEKWIMPMHRNISRDLIDLGVAGVVGCHCKNIRIRCGIKKAVFDPVVLIPRVKGKRNLFEQPRRYLASDAFVQSVKIGLGAYFVCLLDPQPAKHPNLNGNGGYFQRIVKSTEKDLLSGGLVGHFKRALFYIPPRINAEAVYSPFKLRKAAVF